MCEIIVKAVSVTNPDPEKDRRGCYKRGYPVAVYPDGTKWGNEERLPKFVIIKIPGVSVDNPIIQKYTQPHIEPRQQIRHWNIIDWNKALIEGSYKDFLFKPTVLSQIDESYEVIASPERWQKMQDKNDYHPFLEKPNSEIILEMGAIKLSGIVRSVELQGYINTIITRRLWKIRFADLPLATQTKLETNGELTIKVGTYAGTYDYTWAQVKSYFRNQQTGLDETVDL